MRTPVNSIWFHTVLYHKFNGIVFSKFPIDLWENGCDYFDGKRDKTYLLNWILTQVLQYSNLNHSCPYTKVSLKADNVSLEKAFPFTASILPSGQYRVVVSITSDDRVPGIEMQMYGTVLEHYLEKI